MRTRSFLKSLLFVTSAFVFLSNCSGDKDRNAAGHNDHTVPGGKPAQPSGEMKATEPQFQVDEKFRQQIQSVFTAYIELKDALVSSDPGKVQQAAAETNGALADVDMTLVSGAAHNDWMTYQATMQRSLKAIKEATDLEAQRKAFSSLSDTLYKTIRSFGISGTTAYYEYCPMAFDNKGAYWLSDAAEIRNPYFGDEMLSCGKVKEKLQ